MTAPPLAPLYAACLPLGMLMLAGSLGRKKRLVWLVFLVLLELAAIAGCGGGSSAASALNGTPAGNYSIKVTGTGGGMSHIQTVNLVVN